jgi:hypothetical protein
MLIKNFNIPLRYRTGAAVGEVIVYAGKAHSCFSHVDQNLLQSFC